MADEPAGTSTNYDPNAAYTPPVGRLPILGKARAAVDKVRSDIELGRAAQVDNNTKITADIVAIEAQTVAVVAKTAMEETQTADNTRKIDQDIASSIAKTTSETGLLDQKTATELAQTSNTIPATIGIDSAAGPREMFNSATGATVGVIGEQRALFAKQKDGFDRDAEQKMAKIMIDTWSVRQTTDGTPAVDTAGLAEDEINNVLNKAKTGIGVDEYTAP